MNIWTWLIKRPKLLMGIGAIVLIAGAFFIGKYSTPVKTVTQTKVVTQIQKVTDTNTKTNEVKNNNTASNTQTNTNSTHVSNKNKIGKVSVNKTTTLSKHIVNTKYDPNTGKVIETTETTIGGNTVKNTTKDTNTTTATNDTNAGTTTTNTTTAENTNTNTATDTHTDETGNTTSTTTTTTEKGAIGGSNSPFGLSVTAALNPMVHYRVIKMGKVSGDVVGEWDIKNQDVGAGLAATREITNNTFVGAYGAYKFNQKNVEIGVNLGFRF
jgi:hypothetical protein